MATAISLSFSLRKFIQNQIDNGRGVFADARIVDTFEDAGISDLTPDSGGVVVKFPDEAYEISIEQCE